MFRAKRALLALGLVATIIFSASGSGVAKETVASLRVSPLRSYPVQNPGSSSAGKLTLTNKSDGEIHVTLSVENFKTVNDNYDYAFVAEKEARWVRFAADNVVLAKQESREIAYSIAVPIDASPGGHYFALVSTVDGGSGSDIKEIHRVASLVYLEVNGAISRQTHLISVDIPWFSTSRDVELEASLANSGNTHSRARLGITQQSLPFGKTVLIDQSEALTLPSTSRRLTQRIKLANIPALYKFQVTYAPIQGGKEVQTRYVLFLPPWLFLAVPLLAGWLYWEWRRFHKLRAIKRESKN